MEPTASLSDVGLGNEDDVGVLNNSFYAVSRTRELNNVPNGNFSYDLQLPDRLADTMQQSSDILSVPFNGSSLNSSTLELPIDMQYNDGHRLAVIIYSILMIISACGNISVFSAIIRLRMKGRLSRINLFLLHLAIADLLVTFLMMPLELSWNLTVSWRAGDAMCRIMSFFRIFGLFLSGFVLVCISLDRYFAVLKPMAMPDANSRGRTMLAVAWLASVLCSLPQPFIFHVEQHPDFPWYEQCVTFHSFPTPNYELAYKFFGFTFLFGLPLTMIVFCYSRILYEIYRINALKRNEDQLRRSNMGALGRAKIRTLKMTLIIVATFFLCWLPYNVLCLWYWFDKDSAVKVDQRIQKGLFLFACTNSCVNPLIYGLFHFRARKKAANTTMPRSLPNGYRPPIPSENYKMRVRWKAADCCVMGCGSSGNTDSTPVVTTGRAGQDNHIHIKQGQPFWMGANENSLRHCHHNVTHCKLDKHNPTSSTTSNRDIIIANRCSHGTNFMNGISSCISQSGSSYRHHTGHRKCNNFQMVNLDGRALRASICCIDSQTCHAKTQFIDDKNSKQTCLSSIL